jgi:hypothetical protein
MGFIEEPEWLGVVLPNAKAALHASIRDGYYALELEIEFVVLQHFDSVDELVEAKREYIEVEADLVERQRKLGPPIRTTERYVGRRLRVRGARLDPARVAALPIHWEARRPSTGA